jgi:hypothetical protein
MHPPPFTLDPLVALDKKSHFSLTVDLRKTAKTAENSAFNCHALPDSANFGEFAKPDEDALKTHSANFGEFAKPDVDALKKTDSANFGEFAKPDVGWIRRILANLPNLTLAGFREFRRICQT